MAASTLVDFARQERQKNCVVCQLSQDVRAQLRGAGDKGIKRPVQLAWLDSIGHKITDTELTAHYSGRHDDAA